MVRISMKKIWKDKKYWGRKFNWVCDCDETRKYCWKEIKEDSNKWKDTCSVDEKWRRWQMGKILVKSPDSMSSLKTLALKETDGEARTQHSCHSPKVCNEWDYVQLIWCI